MSERSIRAAVTQYVDTLREVGAPESHDYFRAITDGWSGSIDAVVRNIAYGLANFEPGLVVDVGCGHGMQAYVFWLHGHDVLGVDMMDDRLNDARAAATALGADIEYRCGPAIECLESVRAGSVWMHRSIAHMHLDQYLPVVHRVLEPHGTFVFTVSNTKVRRFVPWVPSGQSTLPEMTRALAENHFVVEHHRFQGYLTGLPARWRPKRAASIDEKLASVPGLSSLGGSMAITARPAPLRP